MTKGTATMGTTLRNARGPSLAGARVVVLGYGRSGRAAAGLLARAGAEVRVSDSSSAEKLGVTSQPPGGGRWLGGEDPSVLDNVDLVVTSPGVPPDNPLLAAARERGLPVRSELELGWWFAMAPIIAITGTNGKTTTTELVGAMGRAGDRATRVVGNVGTPLTAVAGEPADLLAVEVSSFQLEYCEDFRPEVAAVLNLTEDHLDWHPDFAHYVAAKRKLFARQRENDAAVLNEGDPHSTLFISGLHSRPHLFSQVSEPARGAFLRDGRVILRTAAGESSPLALSEWQLPGRHNRENLLAAALCARLAGLGDEAIARGARDFRGLAHRMELVAEIDGVCFVNDSKSTNPGSLAKALDPEAPALLIAGGLTKGCDFRPLRDVVSKGVRIAYLIGEGAATIAAAWQGACRTVCAGDLESALASARAEARPGERVLFSPGCASFDQFENYVQRGERFRELVRRGRGAQDDEENE
jgi:UDP-N-acetylmuramoylalanine--D-glutamate ligase